MPRSAAAAGTAAAAAAAAAAAMTVLRGLATATLQLRVRSYNYLRATPYWLCDGLLLGATVATVSLTSALGFSSAVVKVPAVAVNATSAGAAALTTQARLFADANSAASAAVNLLFSTFLSHDHSSSWGRGGDQSWAAACHECRALRLFSSGGGRHVKTALDSSSASSYSSAHATLLSFSTDSVLAETFMSFLISFVIVTFSVVVVREMR